MQKKISLKRDACVAVCIICLILFTDAVIVFALPEPLIKCEYLKDASLDITGIPSKPPTKPPLEKTHTQHIKYTMNSPLSYTNRNYKVPENTISLKDTVYAIKENALSFLEQGRRLPELEHCKNIDFMAINKAFEQLEVAKAQALKEFIKAIAPYYEQLSLELAGVEYLWWDKPEDPYSHYAGSDGLLDEQETRRMVEDGITCLYAKLEGAGKGRLLEITRILNMESDLRHTIAKQHKQAYEQRIEEALSVFYMAISSALSGEKSSEFIAMDNGVNAIIVLPAKN